jgi:hypothetical protein
MKNDEIYLAILNGLITGLTVSIVLGVVGYVAYQKINQSLTAEAQTPLGTILGKL